MHSELQNTRYDKLFLAEWARLLSGCCSRVSAQELHDAVLKMHGSHDTKVCPSLQADNSKLCQTTYSVHTPTMILLVQKAASVCSFCLKYNHAQEVNGTVHLHVVGFSIRRLGGLTTKQTCRVQMTARHSIHLLGFLLVQ